MAAEKSIVIDTRHEMYHNYQHSLRASTNAGAGHKATLGV